VVVDAAERVHEEEVGEGRDEGDERPAKRHRRVGSALATRNATNTATSHVMDEATRR
jgi:hypothetical protein